MITRHDSPARRRTRRPLLIPVVAAALLALAGCAYTVTERHLFHPKRIPPLADAVSRRNVEIKAADGSTLRGWFLSGTGSRLAILYFYGNGETVFESAPLLYRLAERDGADVLAVDYRGYGFSEGKPGLAGIAADAPLLVDELRRLAPPGRPVVVFGRSIGSVFAIRAAVGRRVDGLVLQAPPTALPDVIGAWERNAPWYVRPFVWLRADPAIRDLRPQPIEDVARVEAPLLVIHGTKDRAIPVALGRRMLERAGSAEKRLCEVAGADHNDVDLFRGPGAVCLGQFLEGIAGR